MNAGIDFLEFRPSEIAAAVAISVSEEIQAIDIDKAISCFMHLEKVILVLWCPHKFKSPKGQIFICC